MIVDGVRLLELVKDNKFEDGDEIRPQITTNAIYVYSAYYRNFTDKKTGNQLTVQEYVFWSFDIPEENKEIDIQAIKEFEIAGCNVKMGDTWVSTESLVNDMLLEKTNKLIKAVKQLDIKLNKGEQYGRN
jgi:hypothetical protein